ncbi:MAG: tRNA adenosine(34) deaminase TadA [Desulfatiglans sp.]|jgi:tRNA(adenine34) deaminase|nr:tRNA adenosine(34) deaminase TadA [Thermodesulfobacteriota bacterium]MEE4354067.1 tRNA adenosine(34) deaminase TadA [Desulfatiglans sp.]
MAIDLFLLMRHALEEALKGLNEGEVPVGAVLASGEGKIIARAHNQPIRLNDPTGHAEILAMRMAGRLNRNYRLNNTILVVTIEPCVMCMGAALNGRVGRLVFGAPDPKYGAAGSLFNLASHSRLNHKIEVTSGIMEEECRALMKDFFRSRRANRK